jgi:precorrin-2 methylase
MKALFDVVLGLATGADSLPSEIISHTLTTIAQHVLHADAFEAIVDQVLSASRRQLDQELDWNKIVVIMKAVETVVGVKKGGRIAREFLIERYGIYQADVENACSNLPTKTIYSFVTLVKTCFG